MLRSRIRQWISAVYNSRAKLWWKRLPRSVRRAASIAIYWLTPGAEPHERIPRVYPTLQCNLRCPYCSDGEDYDKTHMGYHPLSLERWVEILDALPGRSIIFTGGEPTLRRDLPEIINAIHQTDVRVYTNLTYDVAKFFDRLRKPVRLFVSFHPNNRQVTVEKFCENLKLVAAHPMCREILNIHMIAHPTNGESAEHVRRFAAAGFALQVHEDIFEINFNGSESCRGERLKTVRCTYDRILIGPDGQRWICVSKMIRNTADGLVGLAEGLPSMVCEEFGRCAPCDEVAEIEHLPLPDRPRPAPIAKDLEARARMSQQVPTG